MGELREQFFAMVGEELDHAYAKHSPRGQRTYGGGRGIVSVLYRIDLPYACGGIVVENGIVKTTAPIFKWMRGKSVESIREWMSTKRGTIRRAAHTEEPTPE